LRSSHRLAGSWRWRAEQDILAGRQWLESAMLAGHPGGRDVAEAGWMIA
jgi:hypothetical protein